MKEQQRGFKSKIKGAKNIENRKWLTIASYAKASNSQEISNCKKVLIDQRKTDLSETISSLYLPEKIASKFDLFSDFFL